MEQLENLRRWLEGFPGWERLSIDSLEHQPGCAGLFPLGMQILGAKQDLLGNLSCRYRWRFRLDKLLLPGQEPAGFVAQFQDWVLRQNTKPLGDDVLAIYARNGRLRERSADGWAVYSVTLTVDFETKLEA